MSIDWEKIGVQRFNVLDPMLGFWTDEGDGFAKSQHKAKTYTQDQLTEAEREGIVATNCIIMSDPDPAPTKKEDKKNNKTSRLENGFDM